jgi:AraC-like DNA-binding protein
MADSEGSLTTPGSAIRSSSLDEAHAITTEAFYPCSMDRLDRHGRLAMTLRADRVGPVMIGDLRYGSDIRICCGELTTAYHVNVPLSGHLESRYGSTDVVATPAQAAVYGPTGDTTLTRWAGDCRQLCIKLERTAVDAELESLLGRSVPTPLTLDATMDLSTGPGRSWLEMALLLAREVRRPGSLATTPLAAASLSRSLITGLLVAAGHRYDEELSAPRAPCGSPVVRRAMELMEARAHQPLTITAVAAEINVSVRALQEGFRRHVQMSPMTYLRTVRLQRVHEDLRRSDASATTVAAVAAHWGFAHLSRFAGAYRAVYGVSPSHTLRGP